MKQKVMSLILAAALLAACLAGCGSQKAAVEVIETPTPEATAAPAAEAGSETAAPSDAAEETEAPEAEPDPEEEARQARYKAAYEKYDPDQTVILVGEKPVSWSEYYSWVYEVASQMEPLYEVTDWNEPREMLESVVPDATFGSYIRKTALGYVTQISVIEQKAEEMGVTLSDAQREELQAMIDGYAELYGGQEGLEELLNGNYVTMDYFLRQMEAMELIDNLFVELYGENGNKLPEADAVAYLEDLGYLHAKHILFKTVDDNREPLPEEEIAEKKAEADGVLAELLACSAEELPERFDALMAQYSEDTGLLANPDGYYFMPGEMTPAFETATLATEVGTLCPELVETPYGYHILYRPQMRGDDVMDYDSNSAPYSPCAYVSALLFSKVTDDWFVEAERSAMYVDGFDTLDFNELFFG